MDSCTFKNNYVDTQFGYGAIYNTAYELSINNSVFINNSAPFNGAVTSVGGDLNILNSIFINNTVYSNLAGYGGAIRAQSGIINIINNIFINNSASEAQAIFISGLVTQANINYCIFEGYNSSVIKNIVSKLTIDANL